MKCTTALSFASLTALLEGIAVVFEVAAETERAGVDEPSFELRGYEVTSKHKEYAKLMLVRSTHAREGWLTC